jgi:predicted transcriptional regulator
MSGKKRERLEVIRDILNSIRQTREIKPTRLLYSSNLSPQMFKDYVDELIKKDFIKLEITDEKRFFTITKKGNDFLQEYKMIEEFVGNFGP